MTPIQRKGTYYLPILYPPTPKKPTIPNPRRISPPKSPTKPAPISKMLPHHQRHIPSAVAAGLAIQDLALNFGRQLPPSTHHKRATSTYPQPPSSYTHYHLIHHLATLASHRRSIIASNKDTHNIDEEIKDGLRILRQMYSEREGMDVKEWVRVQVWNSKAVARNLGCGCYCSGEGSSGGAKKCQWRELHEVFEVLRRWG